MNETTKTGLQKVPPARPRADFHPLAFLERQRKELSVSRVQMVQEMGGKHTDNTVWRIERYPERRTLEELELYISSLRKIVRERSARG